MPNFQRHASFVTATASCNATSRHVLNPESLQRVYDAGESLSKTGCAGDGFDRKVGSGDSGKPADDLHYGLWQAQQIFQESASNVRRRTLIFTTNPDPSGSDTSLRYESVDLQLENTIAPSSLTFFYRVEPPSPMSSPVPTHSKLTHSERMHTYS